MNALLIYPEFPETFWSFKHALKFLGKRAAQPPLGLMTVAALLPDAWKKRLVDTNVEPLRDRDLDWADVVMLSGMHIQSESLLTIVERCRARGLRTVVGGPISSSVPAVELKADHVVIGEAESLIVDLARDLEAGTARPVYPDARRFFAQRRLRLLHLFHARRRQGQAHSQQSQGAGCALQLSRQPSRSLGGGPRPHLPRRGSGARAGPAAPQIWLDEDCRAILQPPAGRTQTVIAIHFD